MCLLPLNHSTYDIKNQSKNELNRNYFVHRLIIKHRLMNVSSVVDLVI